MTELRGRRVPGGRRLSRQVVDRLPAHLLPPLRRVPQGDREEAEAVKVSVGVDLSTVGSITDCSSGATSKTRR